MKSDFSALTGGTRTTTPWRKCLDLVLDESNFV